MADTSSHRIIVDGLAKLTPQIPIISEESEEIHYDQRKDWEYFWLVDPLDGTKEFINKNGEFTVNIALIKENKPILGFVSLPVSDEIYFAHKDVGSFVRDKAGKVKQIYANSKISKDIVATCSRSHPKSKEDEIINGLGVNRVVSAGSALKFCQLASGQADIYLRLSGSMEWDTAAGQIIVESAGGILSRLDLKPFLYNKENLLNPAFISVCPRIDLLDKVSTFGFQE